MTKSTITRERLEEIRDCCWMDDLGLSMYELSELASMALAAMDSESWCLPLDYLQGHKDGLGWAAQLAEANHPETGDWLYDAPIELAKAIRKGPDMLPVQPVADSEPVGYLFHNEYGAVLYSISDDATEGFSLIGPIYSVPQPAPVVPGKWIPVSEQMPEVGDIVLTAMGGVVNVGETECSAANCRFFTSVISGRELPATHWMPLPAAPQESSLACISKRSQHLS